jgi:hypothetical protein
MIEQIFIVVFGVTAVVLSQSKQQERRKYACIFGLLGQPFWFYSAYTAEQWGIFFVCFLYLGAWLQGVWNNWIDNE